MAKSCPCCRLMMSSVSLFLRGRSFSGEKKPAVSSLFSFRSLFVSQSFSCFFVNDDKKDLPLNVQDVFSHT